MWRSDTSIVMNHIIDNCAGPDLGIQDEPVNIGGNLIANIV